MSDMTAGEALLGMLHKDNCYTLSQAELVPLQLEAARELFAQRREQLPILDRRARETGIERIDTLDDLIAAFFPPRSSLTLTLLCRTASGTG